MFLISVSTDILAAKDGKKKVKLNSKKYYSEFMEFNFKDFSNF